MGSFKEYYDDVGNFQKPLSKTEERILVDILQHLRFTLKDYIFGLSGMADLIVKEVNNLSSIAMVTENFNSNKKGNNSIVERKVKDLLIFPTVDNLHTCNFRIDWLMDLVPKVNASANELETIEFFSKKIAEKENRLVVSCLKMAVQLALENRGGMLHEDAVQYANLALVEAAKKFNPACGTRFSTYAHHKILFRMKQKLIEDSCEIVHIPRSANPEPGTGLWLPLDEDVDGGRQRSLADMLPEEGPWVDAKVDRSLIKETLKETLGLYLTRQEADIIFIRYLYNDRMLTYQEVSEKLKDGFERQTLTKERIRQIEKQAITKLSKHEELRELLNYFE